VILSEMTQNGINKFKLIEIYILEGRNAEILQKKKRTTQKDEYNLTFTNAFIKNDSKWNNVV
jgi:hypothetical protein